MKKKKKYTEKDKEKIFNDFIKKLNKSEDIDPEFVRIVNENFHDLLWKE